MSNRSDRVDGSEELARLLLYPQMIKDGKLRPSAFPVDELLARKEKDGSSVDRCQLLSDIYRLLKDKAEEISSPDANRSPYGFFVANASGIRNIKIDGKSEQAFEIWPDPIVRDKEPPKPWDDAHALIRGFEQALIEL